MAWPEQTTAWNNIAGTTTIRWGTGQAWPASATAIVLSADEAEDVEKIYLEQGEGLRATRILLKHGHTWDYTVQDDSSIFATGPNVGDTVVVTNFLNGGTNASNSGVIVDTNYRAARKQEGQRVIRVELMNIVDGTV